MKKETGSSLKSQQEVFICEIDKLLIKDKFLVLDIILIPLKKYNYSIRTRSLCSFLFSASLASKKHQPIVHFSSAVSF